MLSCMSFEIRSVSVELKVFFHGGRWSYEEETKLRWNMGESKGNPSPLSYKAALTYMSDESDDRRWFPRKIYVYFDSDSNLFIEKLTAKKCDERNFFFLGNKATSRSQQSFRARDFVWLIVNCICISYNVYTIKMTQNSKKIKSDPRKRLPARQGILCIRFACDSFNVTCNSAWDRSHHHTHAVLAMLCTKRQNDTKCANISTSESAERWRKEEERQINRKNGKEVM